MIAGMLLAAACIVGVLGQFPAASRAGAGVSVFRIVCLMVLAVLPPLILTLGMDRSDARFAELRLRIDAVDLPRTGPGSRLRIGGNPARDDIVFPGLNAAAAIEGGTVLRSLETHRTARDSGETDSVTVFGVEDSGSLANPTDGPSLLHSRQLEPGDRFCLAACGRRDALRFEVLASGRAIRRLGSAANALLPLPAIMGLLGDREYRPGQAIFPLRDYGAKPSGTGFAADGQDPCRSRWLCDPQTRRPVESFLFFGKGARLHVALLDPGAQVAGAGGKIYRAADLGSLPVAGRVAAWEVVYAGLEAEPAKRPRASYLNKRLGIGVSLVSPDRFSAALGQSLPAATVTSAQLDQVRRLRHETGAVDQDKSLFVTVEGHAKGALEFEPGNVLRFENLGGALAEVLAGEGQTPLALQFPAGATRDDAVFPAIGGAAGNTQVRHGVARFVRRGIGAGNAAGIHLSMERTGPPAWLLAQAWAWSALLFAAFLHPLLRSHRVVIVLGVAQIMLAFRAIVATGAPLFDPALPVGTMAGDVTIAYSAVPALLLALFSARARAWQYPAAAGLLNAACTWLGAVRAQADMAMILVGVASTLVAAATAFCWTQPGARLAGRFVLPRDFLRRRWPKAPSENPATHRLVRFYRWSPAFVWAMVLAVVRVLVGVTLGTERVGFLRLSLIYLPLCLLVSIALIERFRSEPDLERLFAAALAIFVLFVVVPVALHDLGFGLVHLFPVAVLLASAVLPWALRAFPTELWSAAGGLVAGALALALGAPLTVAGMAGMAGMAAVAAIATLRAAARSPGSADRNVLPRAAKSLLAASCLGFSLAASAYPLVSMAVVAANEHNYRSALSESGGETAANLAKPSLDERLERFRDRSGNEWRLDATFNPEAIETSGTFEAEKLRRWRFTLEALTGDFFGRGFPYAASIQEVRANQTDDNLSAVFLMAPFGRFAGAAMILLLGALAWAVGFASEAKPPSSPLRHGTGVLAIWSFAVAGGYMILANLFLLPFTGRNLYLLSANSISDLAEGGLLLAIALFGLAPRDFAWSRP